MRVICLSLFLFLVSVQSTFAALVTFGNLSSDDTTLIIKDTVTNREYFRFGVLGSFNHSDVVSMTSAGGVYEDFNIADLSIAIDFLDALFPGRNGCDGTHPENTLICGFGWVSGMFGGDPRSTSDIIWFENGPVRAGKIGLGGDQVGTVMLTKDASTIAMADQESNILRGTCDNVTWLAYRDPRVKGDSGSIPEPSMIVLLGLGLFGFSYLRRYR